VSDLIKSNTIASLSYLVRTHVNLVTLKGRYTRKSPDESDGMFKILIIEDSAMLRRLLKTTLQTQGFEVIEAESGEAGLVMAQHDRPKLIISDLHLPGISGTEVCQTLKSNPLTSGIFFILLSIDNSPKQQESAQEVGADAFLSKPLNVDELGARLRAWIRLHGLKNWMQSQQSFHEEQQLVQALKFQQQILETELQEAASYVRSLLPKPCTDPIAIDYQFLPSRYLGGDCFDYYWLDDDQLVIYLLDVSGHGLGSALFSVSVQSVLRSKSLPNVAFDQPDQVLHALNDRFQADHENARYFTMWYGVYRVSTQELVYASAGHPPAILISQQSVQALRTKGKPIGLLPEAQFYNAYCVIREPSVLYIFSDGLYEFSQANQQIWGMEALVKLLQRSAHAPLEQLIETVKSKIDDREFDDDCSLIGIQLAGSKR
jgi:phosphoserine phosphatase RsbU/P